MLQQHHTELQISRICLRSNKDELEFWVLESVSEMHKTPKDELRKPEQCSIQKTQYRSHPLLKNTKLSRSEDSRVNKELIGYKFFNHNCNPINIVAIKKWI